MRPTPEGFWLSFFVESSSPVLSEGDTLTNILVDFAPDAYLTQVLRYRMSEYRKNDSLVDLLCGKASPTADILILDDDVPLVIEALAHYAGPTMFKRRLQETHDLVDPLTETDTVITYLMHEQTLVVSLLDQLIRHHPPTD